MDGDEVVQLYVRDQGASVTRPVLELKAFTRVAVSAGDTKRVSFRLPVAQVGFYDRAMRCVVEPGVIDVLVGTSSRDLLGAGAFTVTPDALGIPPKKEFQGSVEVATTGR